MLKNSPAQDASGSIFYKNINYKHKNVPKEILIFWIFRKSAKIVFRERKDLEFWGFGLKRGETTNKAREL